MDNLLVLQKTSNQLEVKNLEKPEVSTVISLGNAIDHFTLSHREDLIAIFTVDQIWHFYNITTAKEVENSSPIPYHYFDIVFILDKSLWIVTLRENRFEFKAFGITSQSPDIERTLVMKELKPASDHKIVKHFLNNDSLFCVLSSGPDKTFLAVIQHVEDRFEMHSFRKLDYQVSLLQPSFDNSFISLLTVGNEIHILDQDSVFKWKPPKSSEKIRSICLDPNFLNVVCIESRESLYFFYYISNDKKFVQICKVAAKSSQFVIVAIRIPSLYTLDDTSKLQSEISDDLEFLKINQSVIDELFGLEYSEFVRQLHQRLLGDDPMLWTTFAKRCLKHSDSESALFCAAKMNNSRLIRSVRTQQSNVSPETLIILLYFNFNLFDETEELILSYLASNKNRQILDKNSNSNENSNENDNKNDNSNQCKALLAKLYTLQNRWEELFQISDTIQQKTHYYAYAKKLEDDGEIDEAIKYYEKSGNVLQVPRMLFETGNITKLQEYSMRDGESSEKLVTWWGQYCESEGDYHGALDVYRKVNDYYNYVRLLCQDQRVNEAIMFVEEQLSKDVLDSEQQKESILKFDNNNLDFGEMDSKKRDKMIPALLYLGKHFEATNPTESIRYYLRCGAIRHALRVCILRRLYDQLAAIAVEHCSKPEAENILQTHILPNRYELESEDSLVPLLYKCDRKEEAFKSGITARAWAELRALCDAELSQTDVDARVRLNNEIFQSISGALRDDTSLIDIFIDIVILSEPDNFTLILSTVQHYGLVLDDHLMDKLERVMAGANTHMTLVETFAELCLEKGNYQLAAKLFNKCGKRVEAMKALIRSGNAEKVIQFANIARDKQIYTMAGNFLQTISYEDSSLIVKFYVRAGATEQLERFQTLNQVDQ